MYIVRMQRSNPIVGLSSRLNHTRPRSSFYRILQATWSRHQKETLEWLHHGWVTWRRDSAILEHSLNTNLRLHQLIVINCTCLLENEISSKLLILFHKILQSEGKMNCFIYIQGFPFQQEKKLLVLTAVVSFKIRKIVMIKTVGLFEKYL